MPHGPEWFWRAIRGGEHADFVWKLLEIFGFTDPIRLALYAVGGGLSGYFAFAADWSSPAIFLAFIGAGAGLSVVYAAIHGTRPLAPPALRYLRYKDSSLEDAIDGMAHSSAWGRWYAATHFVNNGTPIMERFLMNRSGSTVYDKILNGTLEVRGRRPGQLDYEPIPRTHWRSSSFYYTEHPLTLWKLNIVPTGDVSFDPAGIYYPPDTPEAQRNEQITAYDSLIVDGYQFEGLWPATDTAIDRKRRALLRRARRRKLDPEEIRRLS